MEDFVNKTIDGCLQKKNNQSKMKTSWKAGT
jgi:hypothetical protein